MVKRRYGDDDATIKRRYCDDTAIQKCEAPTDFSVGAPSLFWQRPTLPPTQSGSTIGAEGLNFRVRYGIGCDPLAQATRNSDASSIVSTPHTFDCQMPRRKARTGHALNIKYWFAIQYRMRPLILDARNYVSQRESSGKWSSRSAD